jgi:hypothetical protein
MNPMNNGAVANIVNAKPTLLTLIAAKNVTQWAATMHPTPAAWAKSRGAQRRHSRRQARYNAVETPPKDTRQNTSGSASNVINLPKIPVNPKMTTTPWRSHKLLVRPVIVGPRETE